LLDRASSPPIYYLSKIHVGNEGEQPQQFETSPTERQETKGPPEIVPPVSASVCCRRHHLVRSSVKENHSNVLIALSRSENTKLFIDPTRIIRRYMPKKQLVAESLIDLHRSARLH
jgi:hypothetical protein